MTSSQLDLITRIRSMKIMFDDSKCDNISAEAKSLVRNMISKLVDSLHNYAIIPPDAKNLWRTTIIVHEGGKQKRKDVYAKTKEELYQKLYDFYVGPGSLDEIHSLWAEQRKQESLAAATLQREQQRWDKYFTGTDLANKRIDEIDNFQIEAHLRKLIKNESITVKELSEIRFLLRKSFSYAFRHRMITVNPMPDVEVNTSGCAPTQSRLSESRVYLNDEIALIQDEITQEVREIPHNTTALAIRLLFILGLRVGELVALRESDINWEKQTIHIQRMEQRSEKGAPHLVDHTKKKSPYGNRNLPLGEAGVAVIRQVMAVNRDYGFKDEDFLFLGEKGKRIHIRAVDNRIRKLCLRAGIEPVKSAHDIRRTVATKLYRNTHDIELVRKYLGHSDVQTTWGYIVDIDAEEEDRMRVVEALKDLSGPSGAAAKSPAESNIIAFTPPKEPRRLPPAAASGKV